MRSSPRVGGGDSHTAATTTGERIMFAPGAANMSDASLRIVLRHELFHYAARAETAADAPHWLTEGVADFVARPPAPIPANAAVMTQRGLPTDAELSGPQRSLAYDRAWWFTRFVAEEYGTAALRAALHPGVRTRSPRPGRRDAGDPGNRPRRGAGRMAAVAHRLA